MGRVLPWLEKRLSWALGCAWQSERWQANPLSRMAGGGPRVSAQTGVRRSSVVGTAGTASILAHNTENAALSEQRQPASPSLLEVVLFGQLK